MRQKKILDTKKGKRYSFEERSDVLLFINNHNNNYGRGGMTTAVKKFGISAVTIRNWIAERKESGAEKVSHTKQGDIYRNIAALVDEIATMQRSIDVKTQELTDLRKKIL